MDLKANLTLKPPELDLPVIQLNSPINDEEIRERIIEAINSIKK